MEMWRLGVCGGETIVVDALVRRRAAEKALFLTPPEGFVPTPSAVLRPRVDRDGAKLAPAPVVAGPAPVTVIGKAVEPPSEIPLTADQQAAAAAAMDAEQLEALFSSQVDPIAFNKSKKVKVDAKAQGAWWRRRTIGWDLSLNKQQSS